MIDEEEDLIMERKIKDMGLMNSNVDGLISKKLELLNFIQYRIETCSQCVSLKPSWQKRMCLQSMITV